MQFTILPMPSGGALGGDWDEWYNANRGGRGCFALILDDGLNWCGPQAMVLGWFLAMSKKLDSPNHARIKARYESLLRAARCEDRQKELLAVTKMWVEKIGLGDKKDYWSIEDLKLLEKECYQPSLRLKVFSKEHVNACIYEGPLGAADQGVVCLYLHNHHYNLIKTMTNFHSKQYYCQLCNIAYTNREDHSCTRSCNNCDGPTKCKPTSKNSWITCLECLRGFPNQACYNQHKVIYIHQDGGNESICARIHFCTNCLCVKYITHPGEPGHQEHSCYTRFCRVCRTAVNERRAPHFCYMTCLNPIKDTATQPRRRRTPAQRIMARIVPHQRPVEEEEEDPNEPITDEYLLRILRRLHPPNSDIKDHLAEHSFIFFDMECTQELEISPGVFEHVPNLIIAHKCCDSCYRGPGGEEDQECTFCKTKRKEFWGRNCLELFCKWLFGKENKAGTVAIAHNTKGETIYSLSVRKIMMVYFSI